VGFSINTYLILAAVILIVSEFFIPTEASLAAYLMVTFVITREIPLGISDPVTNILVRILIGMVIYVGLFLLHYKVFKKLRSKVVDKYVAPDKRKDGSAGLLGVTGEIKEVEGRLFIKIRDDILPFVSEDSFKSGDNGEVTGCSGGDLTIKKL